MFEPRELSGELASVRDEHAPGALVLDSESDFETLPPSVAESLLAVVDDLEPLAYEASWVPAAAPETLERLAGEAFTLGAPGDGGVAWTRQTDPPAVFVKPRLEGSPAAFVDLLIAEALVEVGTGLPEQFLGFFEASYADLQRAVPLEGSNTYQLAVALFDAYTGLFTRDVFEAWADPYPELYDQWVEAGERLAPRLSSLEADLSAGRTAFPEAAELACSGVKHGLDLPSPFSALDDDAYREHGPAFAIRWAEKTFDALDG